MRIAVFGASGRTGHHVCDRALERGHGVAAHVRSPAKLDVEHDRLAVAVGDAYTGDGVVEAVEGADAVVSVLGQGPSSPDDLLTVAGDNVIAAMADAGTTRFVTLVGAGVRAEGESVPVADRVMGYLLRLFAGTVLEDAREHVRHVRASPLEWTVLRVPRLGEGDPAGTYRIGDGNPGFRAVDRADVASCILDRVERHDYVREMPVVVPG